jgi:hypothetical protein
MSERRVVEIPLDGLEFLHVGNRGFALVNDERMIEVNGEGDEDDEYGYDDDGARGGCGEGVVPEFYPAKYRDFDEEEEEPEDRGEGPGELDEATHALVRGFGHQAGHLQFTDGLDVRQQVRADHQGEYVHRDEDRRAHGEHYEQPLWYRCWLVYLQLDHRHLGSGMRVKEGR